MIQLSTHFTLGELTISPTARAHGISNDPSPEIVGRLKATAVALEAVRELLDQPIRINSGYRSPEVNRLVGGVATSAHCLGYAVDLLCPGFGTPLEVCRAILDSPIRFDQLIHEYGSWTHLSFDPRMRRMPLTIASAKRGYLPGILPIATAR